MPRASGGLIATDVQQEVTTLARVMKIVRRGDNLTSRITDHDQDITISGEVTRAKQKFELSLTDIPGPAGSTGDSGPIPAVGVLSLTGNALDTETVVIGGVTYLFVTGALDATGKVKVGATLAISITNLCQAINAGTGAGVLYASGTTAHATVAADILSITLPDPLEATLLATGNISAYYSNFTTNSGAWHDGDTLMNNPNQAKTTSQKDGMWCGVSLVTGKSIAYAKIFTTQMWQSHNSSHHACGWWFGPCGHLHHDLAEVMMTTDGFVWATG